MLERSELSIARNFIFTHLVGPVLAQGMVIFLYRADPNPGLPTWTIIGCIDLFPVLPILYKLTRRLDLCAVLSTELLTFTALLGTYFYGGVSSPFVPWLIIALLLGFFYLSDRPLTPILLFTLNIACFVFASVVFGITDRVPLSELTTLAWISILSATLYMLWMSAYYANVMSMRSDIEKEAEAARQAMVMLEEQMKQAENANEARSVFLAKMSHELRTPLNAVIGYSELVVEMMDPAQAGSQKESDLKRINAAGKHLLSLVNEVLDFSKIESETIDLREEPFDLDEFCHGIIATIEPMIRKNGNSLVFTCPSKLGMMIGDEVKLKQVILNLLSNAAKFTSNGTVSLGARRKVIDSRAWIEIQIADTGIGIAKEDIPKLFQNYQQASVETSAKYGGTGLGLGICKKFCALMGATLTVSSEPGRGTTFSIRIAAGEQADTVPASSSPSRASLADAA